MAPYSPPPTAIAHVLDAAYRVWLRGCGGHEVMKAPGRR